MIIIFSYDSPESKLVRDGSVKERNDEAGQILHYYMAEQMTVRS
jgi:hypothetical protein